MDAGTVAYEVEPAAVASQGLRVRGAPVFLGDDAPHRAIDGERELLTPVLRFLERVFDVVFGERVLGDLVAVDRTHAIEELVDRGYKPQMIGVTMHKPDESAYHDPSAWVIDDWR